MKLKQAIDKRRSIRSFQEKKVPRSVIKELVKSASKAPSACNRQPWSFYCVDSNKKRDEILKLLFRQYRQLWKQTRAKSEKSKKVSNNFYENIGGAQNLIFVYRKKIENEAKHVKPGDMVSIACAMENLMLCAVEEGLGTCWVEVFKGIEKQLGEILKIKKNEELIGSLVIGYPDKRNLPHDKKIKSLKDILRFV